jgi:hypothetical protein
VHPVERCSAEQRQQAADPEHSTGPAAQQGYFPSGLIIDPEEHRFAASKRQDALRRLVGNG